MLTASIINSPDPIWQAIRQEAAAEATNETSLASFFHATILNHNSLESALSFHLANKLASPEISALQIRDIIEEVIKVDEGVSVAVRADIKAVYERDSACDSYVLPFLYFKGFHALECFRIAHNLWKRNRKQLAYFIQSHIALNFGVDIHPAAQIGRGIMLDHGTGIVIGETCVIEDDVSIMQAVTLGGTGKQAGDRHPKVRRGVLISSGAKILGNIEIGEGAKVGAGSVVLKSVAPHTTVVGVPAEPVGRTESNHPALEMNHDICCQTNEEDKAK